MESVSYAADDGSPAIRKLFEGGLVAVGRVLRGGASAASFDPAEVWWREERKRKSISPR